ncbi:hypothetical protein BGW37DRAFT_424029 [Umbelopsis sp. PMI_123]|nr:hypothetical protein BGW37DRAFT_424029 [Umbelopsis sp. PMI_123]
MATFTDESFSQYAEEYVNCDLTPWEFFVQATNFTIYRRRFEPKPALFEYRVIGGYPDISAKVLSKVYLDLNFRQKWDKNMLCYKELGSKEVLHFVMKYPWPLSNRDYVYQMKLKKVQTSPDRALLVIQGDSVQSYQVPIFEPPTNGVIRIDNYRQNIVIEDDGKGGSLVQLDYFDDPKGSIPNSIINWAAKQGVPGFMKTLHDACIQYMESHPETTEQEFGVSQPIEENGIPN